MYQDLSDISFTSLEKPRRIWAIAAVHGHVTQLHDIHTALLERFRPGDRVIYMGNYTGYGPQARATIDEILLFRTTLLARPGVRPGDITYLRGTQEEMGQKLQQLQFAPRPEDTLLWMLDQGVAPTLESYGIRPKEGVIAAREGTMSLTRWTNKIRDALRIHAGHDIFQTHLRRAAHTPQNTDCPMLFVHSGLDPQRPLHAQGDAFWWGGKMFSNIVLPYAPFQKVVRGYDPAHAGRNINDVTLTIDSGCGFGGPLTCAGLTRNGEIFELLEA